MKSQQQEVALFIQSANDMLEASRVLLDYDFYTSAINRAYYAVFYSANALLATKEISQGKHSGVISAFRQHFINMNWGYPSQRMTHGRI